MIYNDKRGLESALQPTKGSRALLARLIVVSLTILSLTNGCAGLSTPEIATPLPAEYLPTAIALTLEASGIEIHTTATATELPILPSATASATSSSTPTEPATPTPSLETSLPTAGTTLTTTLSSSALPTITEIPFTVVQPVQISTPPLAVPESTIQIYQLGELSMVVSPILVTTRLTSGNGKVVRIDLFGEDGRMLARHVRVFNSLPWNVAKVGVDLEFEISGAAEIGRLVVSVEDPFGRIIDVNSVNLVLLSLGINELNAASTLWQAIVIQQPQPNAFIQGGTVYVSGLARPNSDKPLKVALIAEDGRILGQRLAGLSLPAPGEYGTFAAEVPYYVTEFTPVLLVVYEDGGFVSEFTHLTSIEIILTP